MTDTDPDPPMTGLWLEDGELCLRRDLQVPDPPDGEARVRVLRAGICNTDLELLRGYTPFRGVPGHEFVGRVDAGAPELGGERVVGEINAVCGRCARCRRGLSNHCGRRTVLGIVDRHGAFADYLTLPTRNLHRVPDSISDDEATFIEPLAAALRIVEQTSIGAADRVAVVGDGKLAQLVVRVLARTGCELVAVGHHRDKLALLDEHARTVLEEEVDGGEFDLAVDCAGRASGFDTARRLLRPRGTLVLKSTYAGELEFDASAVVVDEMTIVGSRCGPFEPALDLLRRDAVDVEPLIDARYPLARGAEAVEHAGRPETMKVLVDIEPSGPR